MESQNAGSLGAVRLVESLVYKGQVFKIHVREREGRTRDEGA